MENAIFVMGWPKCGTSSLFRWIGSHPSVQPSFPKETFFLMDPDHPMCAKHGSGVTKDGPAGFERFFDGPVQDRRRVEATTHHVFQETARHFIGAMKTPPHLVFVLREPASRIHSYFRYHSNNLAVVDPALTFDRYVDALLQGDMSPISRYFRTATALWIAERELLWSDYRKWLDLWRGCVPEERFHVLQFEKMASDPYAFVARLFLRLGLDPGDAPVEAEKRENPTFRIGYPGLHRLVWSINRFAPRGKLKAWGRRQYLHLQARRAPREQPCENGLARLRDYFGPGNAALAQDYGVDHSLWEPSGIARAGARVRPAGGAIR